MSLIKWQIKLCNLSFNHLNNKKQFIANASHELRTPLSIIMSGLTVLKTDDENNLSKFSIDTIDDINDESLKMKKLIDNLLLSARNTNKYN